jgi:hypothetical protein
MKIRRNRSMRSATGWLVGAGVSLLVLSAAAFMFMPRQAEAQLRSTSIQNGASPLRVFLDCQGPVPCNRNHFRTEIQWVNWMNDRTDADVHVIITSESVGGGGRRFNLDFIGRGTMAQMADALTYTSSGTDVMIETLDGITQSLRMGLLRYAVESGMGTDFDVAFDPSLLSSGGGGDAASGDASAEAEAFYDPWNYWTFRVGLSGNTTIRELDTSYRINPSFGADRVTEAWKINFNAFMNVNRDKRILPDRVVRTNRDGWNVGGTIVRSVGTHVSTGASVRGGSSTQNNRTARVSFTPAIEWNYYPYSEANRRQLIAHYGAGVQYNRYEEETVFGVLQETVPLHSLGIQYRAVEGWGNAGVSIDAQQYLHESGLHSLGVSGNISFRVARGLELNLRASSEWIQDQIHVPAASLSEEDVLLGRQALPTGYRYQATLGFNYRWGSSFSNVVNTRFPRSVR